MAPEHLEFRFDSYPGNLRVGSGLVIKQESLSNYHLKGKMGHRDGQHVRYFLYMQ